MGPARKYTPQEYAIALKELHGRYEVTLKEMTNSFPYAKAYPELDKYTSLLEKDQSSLNAIRAELFLFRDSIEQDITSVADEIEAIIEKIMPKNIRVKRENPIQMWDVSPTLLEKV